LVSTWRSVTAALTRPSEQQRRGQPFDGGSVEVKRRHPARPGHSVQREQRQGQHQRDKLAADAASNTHGSTDNSVDAKVDVRVTPRPAKT
jgi:hypothetical protein